MLAVIINGLPGAGKTTLAHRLSVALDLPLLSKDAVKETIADVLGVAPPDDRTPVAWNQSLGAAASEVLWTLLGQSRRGAVIETPFLAHVRHFVVAGLARAGVAHDQVHEVWCDVPVALARSRYDARATVRHPIHGDHRDKSVDWALWITVAEPLGFGTLHRIDTAMPLDDAAITALAAAIQTPPRPDPRPDPHPDRS